MTTVGLAGDWHGNDAWARGRVMSMGMRGIRTLLHVGDFGIWPGNEGRKYIQGIENTCRRYDVTIYVTPGNHEDWSQIGAMVPEKRNHIGEVLWLTRHIALLPRGHRFEMDGRTFVSLGGAPSVDLEWRTQGTDWWAEEAITPEDVAATVAGGYADIMLAHDSPDHPWQVPKVAGILTSNPQGWPKNALEYAARGRELMTQAYLGVRPRLFVHGHYHLFDTATATLPDADHDSRIVSLGMDGMEGNVAFLDVDSLEVTELP